MHIGSNILYRHLHATLKVEERIELKNAKENALLSWKNAKENAWSRDDEPTARIQLLTAQAGLLELTVDINRLSELLTPDRYDDKGVSIECVEYKLTFNMNQSHGRVGQLQCASPHSFVLTQSSCHCH